MSKQHLPQQTCFVKRKRKKGGVRDKERKSRITIPLFDSKRKREGSGITSESMQTFFLRGLVTRMQIIIHGFLFFIIHVQFVYQVMHLLLPLWHLLHSYQIYGLHYQMNRVVAFLRLSITGEVVVLGGDDVDDG